MNKLLFALAFVLTVASCSVWADKPPSSLMQHISHQQVIHDQQCNFRDMKGVECLIFFQEEGEVVWLVLFDGNGQNLRVTHVVAIKDKREEVAWCRQDVCI